MTNNPPRRNHFIPEFYTRYWTGSDGRLERYTRPHKEVICRRVYPSQVGWKLDLYASPEPLLKNRFLLEQRTFKAIDDKAATALRRLSDPLTSNLDSEASHWVHFILSLLHRTPAQLEAIKSQAQRIWRTEQASLKEQYADLRAPDDPPTYYEYLACLKNEEIDRSILRILPRLMLSEKTFAFLYDMGWLAVNIPQGEHTLLLSDEPLARSNGIAKKEGHVAMPLTPRRLLVMAWHQETKRLIQNTVTRELVKGMNAWSVESARHFVVAVDRSQSRFIENRFGSAPKPTLSQGWS